MELVLDPNDKNFPKVLSVKKEVMSSVLTASIRMGDNSLRKKNTDRVAALLEEVKRASDPTAGLFD